MKKLICFIGFMTVASQVSGSIGYTFRGSSVATNSASTISIIGVTAASGSSLVILSQCNAVTKRNITGITWTGGTFAVDISSTYPDAVNTVEIWSAHNVTGGTNDVAITWNSTCGLGKMAIAVELTRTNGPLTSSSTAKGSGTGTAATTATSPTCTPNNGGQCAWIANIGAGLNVSGAAPAWTVPTTADQKIGGTTFTEYNAEELDSIAHTQAGSATLSSSGNWSFLLATYLEPAASGGFNKRLKIDRIDE